MNLLLVLLLVAANGFFVAAEFAMVKVRSTRIEQLVIEGNKRARVAQKLIDNLDAYLSATQLGITLASLGLGWVGEQTVASILVALLDGRVAVDPITIHLISGVIAFSFITFLHIVLGELAPKSLAIQRAEGTVLLTAWPLVLFYKLMYPFIRLLNGSANRFLRMIGIRPATEAELAHNEEELRMLVSQSHESGVIDETERNLFDNIFDFTSRVAREIMVPRTDMVTLYAERPFAENMAKVQEDKHTRFPLCIEDKDHIIGIVHIKDLYSMTSYDKTDFDLREIARKPVTVAEATPIKDVLKILQKNRSEMAIVIDEYGGTAGLLTTEDILEELVGEIQDEFDEERPYIEVHGDMVSIDARMLIEDVNEYFNLNLSADEVDTIGGWIYARFENPPQIGAAVDAEGFRFEVSEMDSLRITRLHITRPDEEDAYMIAEMAH
jgi:CBS domain containing-hemolysin-like protein